MASASPPPFLGTGDFTYRSSFVPRFVAAEGSRLRDSDGRDYVDAEAANGAVALGYDPGITREAVEAAASMPALPSFCESEQRLGVAKRLEAEVSRAAGAPGRVAFEVGGAQGIELAMKVVAANQGWGPVVTMQGGYHGRSPFAAALSASARYRQPIPVGVGEVVRLPYPDCERCPFGLERQSCEQACISYLRHLRKDLSGAPRRVAALVVEPVLNVGGMAMPAPDYLKAAVSQFREAGALVVVDEIFTGFHRTGPRFGFELHDLEPDVVVLSKALTNGVAGLSAVWARDPLLGPDSFPPGTHSSTFSGTPFMLAVANAVLDRFSDREGWVARTKGLEGALSEVVRGAAAEAPDLVDSTAVQGGVARLVLRAPVAAKVRQAALETGDLELPGVLLASTGMAPDVIAIHPPLTIGGDDLEVVEKVLARALRSPP